MADKNPVAEWTLRLKDEISGDAASAAKALEELRTSIKGERDELAELQRQMRELKSAGGDNLKQAMSELKSKIDAKRESIAQAKAAYAQLAEKSASLKTRSQSLQAVFGQLSKVTGHLPGPLASFTSGVGKAMSKMSNARLVAVGLAAGFTALAAAAAAGAKSLLDAAIASQDARRNELLHLEALTKLRNLWGIMPGKASDMQAAIDRVSASVSISREKVAGYAEQLYRSGLRGQNFADALEGASVKASALGDAAGSGFAGWASTMALTGGSVKRLAQDVKNRFGGIVQKQMQGIEVQQLKMREGFASLFAGLNIDRYLGAMQQLRSMFNQNTAAGQALKQIVTMLLGPLLDSATDGAVVMRRFFKQVIIGVQQLLIAFLTVRNWFHRTFGSSENRQVLARLFGSFQGGRVLVYALAAAFGVMAVNVLAALAPILLVAAGIYFAIEAMQGLYDLWKEIDWSDLGSAILDGIVGGLKAGWSAVTNQVTELGKDIKFAFKTILGIASPSKVFATLGLAIPQGVQQGVQKGSPDAQTAVSDMVTPELGTATLAGSSAAQPPPAAARASSSSSVTLTIQELHVSAQTDKPHDYAQALRRELESVLEGLTLQLGARPVGGA